MIALFAFLAAAAALMCIGFIGGLYVNRPYRMHIPDHPVLWRGSIEQPRLRLVQGGPRPCDWSRESEGA